MRKEGRDDKKETRMMGRSLEGQRNEIAGRLRRGQRRWS